jgi:uncharacterized membrane protein HdeD (DUF308 family)
MKQSVLVGIVMIVAGVIALAYQGYTYTTREKVVDIGPIEVHADRERSVPIPPIVGGALLIGGVVLVVAGNKKA